jgi:hypothetical protein
VASLVAVVFLSRYFKMRDLLPFATHPFVFGLASAVRFGVFLAHRCPKPLAPRTRDRGDPREGLHDPAGRGV